MKLSDFDPAAVSAPPKRMKLSDFTQGVTNTDTPKKDDVPWGEVMEKTVSNVPGSAIRAAGDIVTPLIHPVETAENLYHVGKGLAMKATGETGPETASADAMVKFFVDRYGSMDALKKTIETDPVGFAMDASTVLTGGGTIAERSPGIIGKVGKAVRESALVPGATQAAKAAGHAVAHTIGGLGTHTGGKAIEEAAKAGYKGGSAGEAFLSNMRGTANIDDVVTQARAAVSNMRRERNAAYRSGMVDIGKDKSVLDFTPIDKEMQDAAKMGVYKGKTIAESTTDTYAKIKTVVDDWRQANPAEFHTPEGMDALKKAVGDIRDSTEIGSPSRVVANGIYNAIKDQIVAQAPAYAKVMKDYETASDLMKEIERTLSLGQKATADTAIRKLQSVLRDNVTSNYGARTKLAGKLENYAPDLMPALSGQIMSSITPRGVGSIVGSTDLLATLWTHNPALAATLPFMSPRLMGEGAYYAGKSAAQIEKSAKALKKVPMLPKTPGARKAVTLGAYQFGRLPVTTDPLSNVLQNPDLTPPQ